MLGNMIRGPLWARVNQHETAHYLLRSDLPREKCRQYAEHLEALRALYEEALSVPAPAGRRAEVVLFNAPEGYHSYLEVTAGSRGETTLGAFSAWYGQLILFEDPEGEETLRVLGHEGFHQYLHGSLGGAPIWFNEGMAEYVAASKVERGKVVERGKILEGRLANLRMALKYGWKPAPFDQIMVESQSSFYGKGAAFKYAQAWSMVHYFLHGEKGKWVALLAAYVKRLAAGDAAPEAFAVTFGKEDLGALEAAWRAYVGGLGGGPAEAASDAPVDLLEMVDLKKDAVWGGWARSGKAVVCAQKIQRARLQIPYAPPAEYDLAVTFERKDGNDALNIGLSQGSTQFVLTIDGWRSTISGIGMIDGRWADNNETTWRGTLLKNNRPSSAVCAVRKDGVTVTVDGKKIISWRGDYGKVRNLPEMAMSSPEVLFIGGWESVYVIHKMILTPVSGHGVKLR